MRARRGHELAATRELAEAILATGELVVSAAGASMEPTVGTGSRVHIVPGDADVGDVALIRVPTGFVLHRIVARLPGGLLVHIGDRPGALPGLARRSALLGRAELPRRAPSLARRASAILRTLLAR